MNYGKIAEKLGIKNANAVSQQIFKLNKRLTRDTKLINLIKKVESELNNNTKK